MWIQLSHLATTMGHITFIFVFCMVSNDHVKYKPNWLDIDHPYEYKKQSFKQPHARSHVHCNDTYMAVDTHEVDAHYP